LAGSVLSIFSKIFGKILEQQLSDFFENIFNPYLCAFGRGHACQTTLLRLLEDWRNALDQNQYAAAVLMDLSKAFDCLPHDILLDKLSAYGMSCMKFIWASLHFVYFKPINKNI
jgi:hypothetical protein